MQPIPSASEKKNDVWMWNQSQVDAYPHSIKYKLNLMSSQAPPQWHFLSHFSTFLFTSIPLFPPTTSLHLPRSVSHSESTSVPPSFPPPLHPKQRPFQKEGHQSSSVRPACERVPRLQRITISPYPPLNTCRRRRQRGREGLKRVKETILDIKRTHKIVKAEACRVKKHSSWI